MPPPEGVVVAMMLPLPLTARKVLARPVIARFVVVALANVVLPLTFNVPVAVRLAAVKFPLKYPFPFTSNLFEGDEVPMPRLPLAKILKRLVKGDDEAMVKSDDVEMRVVGAWRKKGDDGVLVPMPKLPPTVRVPVAVMFAAVRFPLRNPFPLTSNLFEGDEVPNPTKPLSRTFMIVVVVAPPAVEEAIKNRDEVPVKPDGA